MASSRAVAAAAIAPYTVLYTRTRTRLVCSYSARVKTEGVRAQSVPLVERDSIEREMRDYFVICVSM